MKGGRGVNKMPATVGRGLHYSKVMHGVYADIPKHVLFDCAMYLAANVAGAPDTPTGSAALKRLYEEWDALYLCGITDTKRPGGPERIRRSVPGEGR